MKRSFGLSDNEPRSAQETQMQSDRENLELLDKRYLWHPFTPMQEWIAEEHHPLMLVAGDGVWVSYAQGNKYLDGNSSIWTNIHGHNHPAINSAIVEQLQSVAHTSFLGSSNPSAVLLAEKLVRLIGDSRLSRVFYSDDCSTGIEGAIKMTRQHVRVLARTLRSCFLGSGDGF